MALADTARLVASLELQDKFSATAQKFDRTVGGMDARTRRLDAIGQHIGSGVRTAVGNIARLSAVAAGVIAVNVKAGVDSLQRLEDVQTQTEAVLKSTRGAAGLTATDIRKLADEYENLNATIDDKVIQSGENLLLTFTNIDKKSFQPALEAALDMNQAMGGGEEGLQNTVIRLGKALQDPVAGFTALRRVGVNLTKDQQDQIKKLVAQNDLYGAQQIILKELSKEFGGSFAKAGDTATAKFAKFQDAVENAQQSLARAFLPVLARVADKVTAFLSDPQVQRQIEDFGKGLASGLDNLIEAAGKLDWGAIGNSLKIAGTGAKAVFDAFTSLPSWVQTAVLTGWGLNKLTGGALTGIAGELGKGLFSQFAGRGATPANPIFTKEVGLGGAPGGGVGGAGGGSTLTKLLGGALAVFGGVQVGGAIGTALNENTIGSARNFETGKVNAILASADAAKIERAINVIESNLKPSDFGKQVALALDINGVRSTLEGQKQALEDQLVALGYSRKQAEQLIAHESQVKASVDAGNTYAQNLNSLVTNQTGVERTNSGILSRTRDHMASMLTKEDRVAANTAAVANKDFSPKVSVAVDARTTVSVNDVIRQVGSYQYAVNTFGAKIGNLPTG